MPTAREIIMAVWFGPIVDPDYNAACDSAAEREENWNGAEDETSASQIQARTLL
jgi:hypothetical protein